MSNRLAGRRLTLDDLKPAAPSSQPEPQPAPPVVQEKSAALPSFLPKPLAEAPHNPASAKSRKRQAVWEAPGAAEMLRTITARWPVAFQLPRRPLAVGICRAIIAELGEEHAAAISGAMMRWTTAEAYQRALSQGSPRIGLDGSEVGSVSERDQAGAATILLRREARKNEAGPGRRGSAHTAPI